MEYLGFSAIDYLLFTFMCGLSCIVGIYFGCCRDQTTTIEYFLGGKKMRVFPVAMSLVASTLSGIGLLSVPAEVYMHGTQISMLAIAVFIMGIVNNYMYLPVFHRLQLSSVNDYLEIRFDKYLKLIASFLYIVTCILFLPLVIYAPSLAFTQAYYWRDYNGELPWDAFPAGQDQNEQPIYIGQTLYGATLLPSKIYSNDDKAYYTWGDELSSKENVKIFCTQHPEQLEWISTTKDGLHSLINKSLVKGGYEAYYDLYIGRGFHKMQTLVGTVRAGATAHLNVGLHVSVPGKEVHMDSFEVLAYDPEGNYTDTAHC